MTGLKMLEMMFMKSMNAEEPRVGLFWSFGTSSSVALYMDWLEVMLMMKAVRKKTVATAKMITLRTRRWLTV